MYEIITCCSLYLNPVWGDFYFYACHTSDDLCHRNNRLVLSHQSLLRRCRCLRHFPSHYPLGNPLIQFGAQSIPFRTIHKRLRLLYWKFRTLYERIRNGCNPLCERDVDFCLGPFPWLCSFAFYRFQAEPTAESSQNNR